MAGRRLETFEDFKRSLKNKYGVGEGKLYKPWLRVQDVKSKGVRSQILGLKTHRVHHTLSLIETEFFYLAEHCDSVIDIREQFPLFPINLSIKIAESLGVKHPTHPKTNVPIIITTDFLLTRSINGQIVFEAISVKPETESDNQRVLEKLEIERVWWELLGINFSYFVGSESTKIQSNNINWATHPLREGTQPFTQHQLELAIHLITPGKQFIRDICNDFVERADVVHDESLNLLRILIAKKYISVDISYSLENADFINILTTNFNQEDLAIGNS
ncbi:TnsA endonuclease N-terminal domain-containing protein [Colwellia sp. Bg11-28]|uniref:TnsA endonuclease N-terminal domain-containing protein n=1 Tax=Colwellia sp. Bg11-28 TaxID=2058305 RepID=UPI000C33F137|nr:TnsA endonuclease N-terminal domain-containing protein [Colwellia sp. Bg11-28]PKH88310.1 heteromeric transposase endonuclease subunit TnsA [Colwellia sp. Bg11-28]